MRTLYGLINDFFRVGAHLRSLGILLLFAPWPGTAGQSRLVTEGELSEKLKLYRAVKQLDVNFTQLKHLAEMNLDLKSSGRLSVNSSGEVRWEIQKPSAVTVQIDAEKVQITSRDDNHVFQLKEISQDNVARGIGLMLPWLKLDAKTLASEYKITKVSGAIYDFEPKKPAPPMIKMTAEIAKDGHVRRLKLFETSGDSVGNRIRTPSCR